MGIIVIGQNKVRDIFVLSAILCWWKDSRGLNELTRLELFDMGTRRCDGDAFDKIAIDTELVVTLDLWGLDGLHVGRIDAPTTWYQGRNAEMLERCMELRVPMICWQRCGEGPWKGKQKQTLLPISSTDRTGHQAYLFEPFDGRSPALLEANDESRES